MSTLKCSSRGLWLSGCIFLTVFGVYVIPAQAGDAEIILLTALGYSRGIVLRGVNPDFSVSLPVPMGGINHAASFVRLHLEPAPLLDNGSSVRIEFNGRPVTAVGVASLRAQPALDVPIPPLPPWEAFIQSCQLRQDEIE